MAQTTIKVSKEAVDFMKSEGRYGDSLATICDRLFEELKTLRSEKMNQGNFESLPVTA
ncbi:MAG: hypothetical protein AB7V04_01025 [Desulfomonilaceae bacterium]|jgi:hypothetical protein